MWSGTAILASSLDAPPDREHGKAKQDRAKQPHQKMQRSSEPRQGSKPIRPDGVSHRFTKLARRLGVRCRLHDLRHYMVTQLIAAGVDVRTVAGRAGHVDGGRTTLGTYAHFQQAQDRHAAELMEGLLRFPGEQAAR